MLAVACSKVLIADTSFLPEELYHRCLCIELCFTELPQHDDLHLQFHGLFVLSVCRLQYWKALYKLVAPGGVVVWSLLLATISKFLALFDFNFKILQLSCTI
jgi:hypothetical protein